MVNLPGDSPSLVDQTDGSRWPPEMVALSLVDQTIHCNVENFGHLISVSLVCSVCHLKHSSTPVMQVQSKHFWLFLPFCTAYPREYVFAEIGFQTARTKKKLKN